MHEDVHVHEIISYSSDVITSIRTNVKSILKRFVHKLNLEAQTYTTVHIEKKSLLTVKPSVQSKYLNVVLLNIRS